MARIPQTSQQEQSLDFSDAGVVRMIDVRLRVNEEFLTNVPNLREQNPESMHTAEKKQAERGGHSRSKPLVPPSENWYNLGELAEDLFNLGYKFVDAYTQARAIGGHEVVFRFVRPDFLEKEAGTHIDKDASIETMREVLTASFRAMVFVNPYFGKDKNPIEGQCMLVFAATLPNKQNPYSVTFRMPEEGKLELR